jgi:hypothetical protein
MRRRSRFRASHILLKTQGKDDAAVKKQAEDLLAKAKSGADFGKLASQYSEDDVSKAKAGDLDFFSKGQMVPEFDKAAFSLKGRRDQRSRESRSTATTSSRSPIRRRRPRSRSTKCAPRSRTS